MSYPANPGDGAFHTEGGVRRRFVAALDTWVRDPLGAAGAVSRQSISGAAVVDVSGGQGHELEIVGGLSSLALVGWDPDPSIYQRARVELRQDAIGGHMLDPHSITGVWVEAPPAVLSTTAGQSTLQFYAVSTDGGVTIWLEPVGVSYFSECLNVRATQVTVPAVTAGDIATFVHDFAMVTGAELLDLSTGLRVLTVWGQVDPQDPASDLTVEFSDSWPVDSFVLRVTGLAAEACDLSVSLKSLSQWVEVPLALTAAVSVNMTLTHSGAAGSVEMDWGDGNVVAMDSAVLTSHTYAAAFTGSAVLRYRPSVAISGMSTTQGPWAFSLADIPRSVVDFSCTNVGSVVHGGMADMPRGIIDFVLRGSNVTGGVLADMPRTVERYENRGSNVVGGALADMSPVMESFYSRGANVIGGAIGGAPSSLVDLTVHGANVIDGDVGALHEGLVTLDLTGNNTTDGLLDDLPSSLTFYSNDGANTVGGSVANAPANLLTLSSLGDNVTNGPVDGLPATLTFYRNEGNNTTDGDPAGLPANLASFTNIGLNQVDLVGTYTPPATLSKFANLGAVGLSATDVDALLVAIEALGTSGPGRSINLSGNNAAPTAAGQTAATNLVGRGWAVTTN